ncbi:MAG: hypothetical protein C0605_07650 [Hyphomicrobiales bacterium]|nr:MAG: hypothetical protein C0605_07650 [Hyphomicrobiales bacterium]
MSDIVDQAIQALMTLPTEERDRIAYELIERLEDKNEWDGIVWTPKSQAWLEKASAKTLKTYEKQASRLSYHLISLPSEEYLREDSYWKAYEDLPQPTRALAEKTYKLWKEDPAHSSLRFRQVHESLPVFSFRVGMKHRTIGIKTPDDKMAWFWVGSFDQYQELVGDK